MKIEYYDPTTPSSKQALFFCILLPLVVIQQDSFDLFRFQSLIFSKEGCNQVFVGSQKWSHKHQHLIFIIELHIDL